MKQHVADTHALLWFFGGQQQKLGRAARRVLSSADGVASEVLVSVVSVWEVAQLHDEGHITLASGFSAWCDSLERAPGLRIEPLQRGDVECARALGSLRDPNDRLIAGAANRLAVPLLTVDARIAASKLVRVVWQ